MIVGVTDAIHGHKETAESARNLFLACTCGILIALTYTFVAHAMAIQYH